MNVNERIAKLRLAMKEKGVNAYIIPSNDPHMSEYVSTYWMSRAYFSGFTGSAGTLVITEKTSGLWTDGRYYIQAAKQLEGSEIQLFKMGEKDVPPLHKYLATQLSQGEKVGIDGRLFSVAQVKKMQDIFKNKNIHIVSDLDLVTEIWQDRPEYVLTEVYIHEKQYTGFDTLEKLGCLRKVLERNKITGYVLTELASIAWLFNIRAHDIMYNPMATAYGFITQEKAYLCIDSSRMSEEVRDILRQQGVSVVPYGAITSLLEELHEPMKVLCDKEMTNYGIYKLLEENPNVSILQGKDIITEMKAIKNPVEIDNIEKAHVKDGCAMVKFIVRLEEGLAGETEISEYDLLAWLKEAREQEEGNKGESFASIVGYKENAAMMHYAPTKENHKMLKQEGLLLIDSGGQYLEGTTDITRTFALGPTTEEEKLHYTLTLKSHIALAKAVFMEGCTGGNLDILARMPMWEAGLDYKCGTGHGVGFFLGVHEGPQNLRITNQVVLKKGMLLTDEPGVYKEGKHGIRIENILLIIDRAQTKDGKFYQFKTITYFPIDTAPLLLEKLSQDEISWLNSYHEEVYTKLAPRLTGKHLEWLQRKTRPISK